MTTNTEAEVAIRKALRSALEHGLVGAAFPMDDCVQKTLTALRTASQGECAAHPGECSMGSHGPGGAIQCKHCGNEATPASASDAVYQIECDGYWYDTSAEYFHGHDGSEKRILYTRPASAEPDVVPLPVELHERVNVLRDKAAAHEAKRDASGEGREGEHSRLLGELLAVIHRDGGHYTVLSGVGKSVADAMDVVVTLHHMAEQQGDATNACYQAYQAVSVMLSDLGLFDSDRGEKLLDNLSQARVVHEDVLPWPSAEQQRAGVPDGWIERARVAVGFSHNFATAKPNINDTEQIHILGLCRLIEEALAAATQPQEGAGNG